MENHPRWTVYHADNPNFGFGERPKFPQEYTKVALVACENIEDAFRLTNHIERDWKYNPEIIWYGARCRSTSVGDIVIDPDLGIWYCDSVGWEKLDK